MGHMANASPSNDKDPGAYIVTFGEYAGHRLDSIPSNLRLWATGVKCRGTRWYAAFKRANEQYETLLLQSPEAYPLPFGDYEDTQLSQVPEYYMRWAIHPSNSNSPWYRNLVEANRRYRNNAYQSTPSGSVMAPLAARGIGNHSCPLSEDLVGRRDALPTIPPRPYRKRRPANVQNPVGKLVDQRDDVRGSAGPDDKYELDDFVVPDDDEGASDFESDYGADPTSDNNLQGPGSQTEQLSPSRSSTDDSQTLEPVSESDSDNDTPLGQLRNKMMAKRVAGKRKAEFISSPSPQRKQQSSGKGSDDDIVAQPPRKRLKDPRLVHKPAQNDFHSDTEPVASTSRLDDEQESPHHRQLSHSSQESAASSSTADELLHTPKESSQTEEAEFLLLGIYENSPARLGSRYRARIITDSDEETS